MMSLEKQIFATLRRAWQEKEFETADHLLQAAEVACSQARERNDELRAQLQQS